MYVPYSHLLSELLRSDPEVGNCNHCFVSVVRGGVGATLMDSSVIKLLCGTSMTNPVTTPLLTQSADVLTCTVTSLYDMTQAEY